MSMLQPSPAFKPFHYPWAYQAWLTQNQIHWLALEIPLGQDVIDWKSNLTPEEKALAQSILTFFTQADVDVEEAYVKHYLKHIKNGEIQRMLLSFAHCETIHIDAYSHLLDTLGMPETIYTDFLGYEEMVRKHEFSESFNSDSPLDLAVTMASFGAFVEGMMLFASFCVLLNFQRTGKLRGCGQIVAWSVRDETLHCQSVIKMFHAFVEENDLDLEEIERRLAKTCKHAVDCEDAFLDLAFSSGGVNGLSLDETKLFIRHIANLRMDQLGMKRLYDVNEDPLPWFADMIGASEHASFFENKPTSYSKGASKGSWDDAFA